MSTLLDGIKSFLNANAFLKKRYPLPEKSTEREAEPNVKLHHSGSIILFYFSFVHTGFGCFKLTAKAPGPGGGVRVGQEDKGSPSSVQLVSTLFKKSVSRRPPGHNMKDIHAHLL